MPDQNEPLSIKPSGWSGGHRFEVGEVVIADGCRETIEEELAPSETSVRDFLDGLLTRHVQGDWGEIGAEDWAANNRALREGRRLVSVYPTPAGRTVLIVTNATRERTEIRLASGD